MYILHKKFCKRIMFPGYYNIFHIHLAKYKRRYYKLKMSCVRVHYVKHWKMSYFLSTYENLKFYQQNAEVGKEARLSLEEEKE